MTQEQPKQSTDNLLYIRQKQGIYSTKQIGLNEDQISINSRSMNITAEGSIIISDNEGFIINQQPKILLPQIQNLQLSPDEEYIIITIRQTCSIYSIRTNQLIKQFQISKSFTQLYFDSTNSLCFVKNQAIEVYSTIDFNLLKQFNYPENADFAISTQRDTLVLSFVTLVKHFQEDQSQLIIVPYQLQQSSTFPIKESNEVKQLWSKDGLNLLVWSQLLEDASNQSYFGVHALYLYANNLIKSIELYEGPIHDVKWMQDGFIAISGYVPSGAVLYNNSGDQIYIILQAHINSIYPSPDCKQVVLAGFGNLSGDIYVYDLQQMKKTAQFKKDKVVTFSWSPDGLYFLMATTFPRLRVNNSYHIYSKEGKYVFHQEYEELYEVKWQPNAITKISGNISQLSTQKVTKEITLNSGFGKYLPLFLDFIKELKGQCVVDQPKLLAAGERLVSSQQQQQQFQLQSQQQYQQIQPVQQQPAKPKTILMRRQVPMVEIVDETVVEQQQQQQYQQQQQQQQESWQQ